MRYLKKFNESSSYTIDDYISDNFKVYNEQFSHELKWKGTARGTNVVPHLVLSRASTGLLLLTQSTKKNQNLTEIIVEISILIDPIMQQIGKYNREKYENLMNINSSIHNRHFDEKEYITRIIAVCPPLEFIQTCYFESDEETPFDLNKFSELYSKIKKEAEEVFDRSIWSKKKK
jgi:hypothetical protein